MKILFKQRIFSWLDSYDIFDEDGNTIFYVKSQLSWGHCFKIFDIFGNELATVTEKILTLLPKFEIEVSGEYRGCISREFTFFRPKYNIDFNNWQVSGNVLEWDYEVQDKNGFLIATISREFFRLTDTYSIEVYNPDDLLDVLAFALAMDAEKCSRERR